MVTEAPIVKASVTIRVQRLAYGLRSGAVFLEVVAVLSVIGGVILGVYVAAQESTSTQFEESTANTHPYVGTGIAIIVGALVGGIFYWCIARALRLFAEHVAIVHDVDLDSGMGVMMDDGDDDDDDEVEDDDYEQESEVPT